MSAAARLRALCVVPARGGSKGIPDKNLQKVAGVSLVGHAVRVARRFSVAVAADVRVVVDSDADRIADEGRHWGAEVPFLRSPELATETASSVAALLALLDRLETGGSVFDVVVLLQPTSPLRSLDDVLRCWQPVADQVVSSTVAVTGVEHPLEHAMEVTDASFSWALDAPPARRQDAHALARPSGSAYVARVDWLRQTRSLVVPGQTLPVEVPQERAVDIDTPADLRAADALLRTKPARPIDVGERTIGPGHPCFVIAEAGVNHNGDVDMARQLIDVAAAAGADAVKFQTFDPATVAAANAPKARYQQRVTATDESQLDMLRQLALPEAAYRELRDHAHARGVEFLSTPFDAAGADLLASLGVPALKVASGELTNHPLLEAIAGQGLPLLISTGMADMAEVAAALDVVDGAGAPPVALFHCVSDYPAVAEDCNLEAIISMRATFGVPVGWSDHTTGISISLGAVAIGAALIEKHVTLDRSLPGPDHAASLEPDELAVLVREIHRVEASIGNGIKRPMPAELETAKVARRSLHLRRDLAAGERLAADDLVALRPGTGVAPSRLDALVGRVTRIDLPAGHRVAEADLQ